MCTDRTSADALKKLSDRSLLETDHKGSYWLHPLVREFSYDDLGNKREAHRVAVQYYRSQPIPEERIEKADVQSLIEACYHACTAGDYDMAADIIFDNKLHKDLDRWGNYTTIVELYENLLPERFDEERRLTSVQAHGAILGNLGLAYAALGQVKRAIEYHKQALVIAKEIDDRRGEGAWLNNLGMVFEDVENYDLAMACYLVARTIHREIRDPNIETTENNINALKTKLGKRKFQKLLDTVEPNAEEIIQQLLT